MCAVSYVGNYFANTFPQRYPEWPLVNPGYYPSSGAAGIATTPVEYATKADLDAVRKEIQELKELLLAAKKYDEATNQPDCHMDDKVALIKAVAKAVGVDMNDVFPEE
jgi:hypothetical protein